MNRTDSPVAEVATLQRGYPRSSGDQHGLELTGMAADYRAQMSAAAVPHIRAAELEPQARESSCDPTTNSVEQPVFCPLTETEMKEYIKVSSGLLVVFIVIKGAFAIFGFGSPPFDLWTPRSEAKQGGEEALHDFLVQQEVQRLQHEQKQHAAARQRYHDMHGIWPENEQIDPNVNWHELPRMQPHSSAVRQEDGSYRMPASLYIEQTFEYSERRPGETDNEYYGRIVEENQGK